LTVKAVVISSCWWRGCGVICLWWPRPSTVPSWCQGETGIRLQSPSSRPSNRRARPVTVWMSFDLQCNATCVNSCQICSDAHNIGQYRIRFYLYDTPSIGSDTIPMR